MDRVRVMNVFGNGAPVDVTLKYLDQVRHVRLDSITEYEKC